MNTAPQEFGDASRFQSVEVDDHVIFANRHWRVTGVFLGCQGQENVATIVAMDRKPGYIGQQGPVAECIVPLEFLYGRIYRYVKPGDAVARPRVVA